MGSSIIYSPLAPDYCDRLLQCEIGRAIRHHQDGLRDAYYDLQDARQRFEEDKHDLARKCNDKIGKIRANHNKLNLEAQKCAEHLARPMLILPPSDPKAQLVHYTEDIT